MIRSKRYRLLLLLIKIGDILLERYDKKGNDYYDYVNKDKQEIDIDREDNKM